MGLTRIEEKANGYLVIHQQYKGCKCKTEGYGENQLKIHHKTKMRVCGEDCLRYQLTCLESEEDSKRP